MNNIKEADLLTTLPNALRQDAIFLELAKLVADELHATATEIEKNIIYSNIDTLSEACLDVLAYDLHVDWYNYDYPIDAKRAIIKDSVIVHKKLGTKYATERALSGLHPYSEIEEWFEYGGTPYRFRIVLDTTKSRVTADYDEIVKTVDIYKRLTAHLDGLFYQCSINIKVGVHTDCIVFSTKMTGRIRAGEVPRRNTEGAVGSTELEIITAAEGYISIADMTGTKPGRSTLFSENGGNISTMAEAESYQYSVKMCGCSGLGK